MKFELNDAELEKFEAWEKEIYKKGVKLQKKTMKNPDSFVKECWKDGYPYTGAIGGQFMFIITQTSLGPTLVVKDAITNEELNLTDYDMW